MPNFYKLIFKTLTGEVMSCNWKSKISSKKCNRTEFEQSGFCIYHKPNKDVFEGALFWGLMNYSYDNYNSNGIIDTLFANLQQLNLLNEMDLDFDETENKDEESIQHHFLDLSVDEFRNFFNDLLREKDVVQDESGFIDFSGFCFPEEPFNKLDIDKYFLENDKLGRILFNECIFEGEANFQYLTFHQSVYFINTKFLLSVNFSHSIFEQKCIFDNVQFNDIYPISTTSSYWKTGFEGLVLVFKNIKNCIAIDGINLSDDTDLFLQNVTYSDNNLWEGQRAYRIAKQQASKKGNTELAGTYYYQERLYKGRKIFPKIHIFKIDKENKRFVFFKEFFEKRAYKYIIPKIEDLLSKAIVGYGERPTRSLFFSLAIIFIFSLIFMFVGLQFNLISNSTRIVKYHLNFATIFNNLTSFKINNVKLFFHDYGNFLYFSIATFTTVGYGDITPYNFIGRVFSAIEMLLGITLAGIWVATLLRKMLK